MTEARLIVAPRQAARIIEHARSAQPEEVCGLLAGRSGRVTEVYPLPNTEQSPVRYLADPQAQLDAMLAIEESGLEIVGIYHSHPDTPAFPSPTDVAMAAYPNAVHLIISLMEGKQPVFGAFWIRNGEITPVDIIIDAARAVRGREAAGSW